MSNYAFEGPKWSTSNITWSFAPAGGNFSGAIAGAYQDTVKTAIARWAQVANLTFQQVSDSASVNIRIGWGQFSGNQIGETGYSYTLGANQRFSSGVQVRLEDPSARALGPGLRDYYQGTATTLYEVTLHEFGHALGLDHSSDPVSVMYPSVGPNDNDIGASDIQGIQVLYGAPATTVAQNSAPNPGVPILPATITLAGDKLAVYRFFDTKSGTQFLTASDSERNTVLTTRPDLTYEGLGLAGIAPGADPSATPIYRFFDLRNGTHFFTANQAEQSAISATRSDLVLEPTTFYEHTTQQAGDVPVYRFFDKTDGTHFFTSSPSERAAIQSTRADMAFEGVAFYSPS